MNGSPNAEQKRYHDQLREMFREVHGGTPEIHHIFGAQAKFKLLAEAGIKKPGEWFVIAMSKEEHKAIDDNKYSFEAERGLFMQQRRDYKNYFKTETPVPVEIFMYYNQMTSKHQGLRSWSE